MIDGLLKVLEKKKRVGAFAPTIEAKKVIEFQEDEKPYKPPGVYQQC